VSSSCEFLFLGRCSSEFESRVCEIYLKTVEFELNSSENSSEFEFFNLFFNFQLNPPSLKNPHFAKIPIVNFKSEKNDLFMARKYKKPTICSSKFVYNQIWNKLIYSESNSGLTRVKCSELS